MRCVSFWQSSVIFCCNGCWCSRTHLELEKGFFFPCYLIRRWNWRSTVNLSETYCDWSILQTSWILKQGCALRWSTSAGHRAHNRPSNPSPILKFPMTKGSLPCPLFLCSPSLQRSLCSTFTRCVIPVTLRVWTLPAVSTSKAGRTSSLMGHVWNPNDEIVWRSLAAL